MKQVLLIVAWLTLASNFGSAQDKVIRWAKDSLIIHSYDTIVRQMGNAVEGVLELKNANGKTIYEIRKGLIQSKYSYHFNDRIREEEHFKNKRDHGIYKLWNKQGRLITEGKYKKGSRNGKWVFYYNNGNKQVEGRFLNYPRQKEAFYLEFVVDSEASEGMMDVRSIKIKGALPEGSWEVYDKNGQHLESHKYRKGALTAIRISHY